GASRRCARRTPGLQRVLRPLRCRLGLLSQTSLHYLSQYHNDPDEVIVQIEVREPEERAADGIADQAHLYHRGEIARPDEVRPLLRGADDPRARAEREPSEQPEQAETDEAMLAEHLEVDAVRVVEVVR